MNVILKWTSIKNEGDALKPVFLPFFHPGNHTKQHREGDIITQTPFFQNNFPWRVDVKQGWVDRYRRKNIIASDFRKNQQNPLLKHEGHSLRCKIQMPCDNNGNRMLVLRAETPWDLAYFCEWKEWHKQGVMLINYICRKKSFSQKVIAEI